MQRVFAIVLGITACGVVAALAVTREEVAACYPDAVRLCGVARNAPEPSAAEKLRVGACMLLHRDELSPRCRAVLKAHGF